MFFCTDTATTEIYTLSLHDALPISVKLRLDDGRMVGGVEADDAEIAVFVGHDADLDRKSTRPNSSHVRISYAVFCLKKKKDTAIGTASDNKLRFATIRNERRNTIRH